MLWMIALGDRPGERGVVPRFGCARPDLGVLSTAYVSGLSLWERVRAWAGPQEAGLAPTPLAWRSLFVRGLAAFFSAWRASDGRIVPGHVVPTNVDVPRADYLRDVRILSLAGWRPYDGPRSLVEPMQRYFLDQAAGHYPALRGRLDPEWIYEAAVEALGVPGAEAFLGELASGMDDPPGGAARLAAFRERLRREYREPLALRGAVARYADWQRTSPKATPAARRQLARQMLQLYGLEAQGELARYHLYRRTYFAEATAAAAAAFDRLLAPPVRAAGEPATRLVELSELQAALHSADDRRAFGELVFPRAEPLQEAELRSQPGLARVFVLSHVTDGRGARFAVREPAGPAEVGRLYRLLSESGLAVGRELAPPAAARRRGARRRRHRLAPRRAARRARRGPRDRAGAALAAARGGARRGLLRPAHRGRLRRRAHAVRAGAAAVRAGVPRRPPLGRARPLPAARAAALSPTCAGRPAGSGSASARSGCRRPTASRAA